MKLNENGRSMVEILGVLAIIGVLSVTGIYAYTTAMMKHKMNQIVQTASMLSLLSKSNNAGEGVCVKLSEYNSSLNIGGVNVDIMARPGPEDLTDIIIKFADGDPDHKQCDFILNMIPDDGSVGYKIFGCGGEDEVEFDCDDD